MSTESQRPAGTGARLQTEAAATVVLAVCLAAAYSTAIAIVRRFSQGCATTSDRHGIDGYQEGPTLNDTDGDEVNRVPERREPGPYAAAGLAAAATLIVAALAAVGIEGQLITRMVRNLPIQVGIAVSLALLAVAVGTALLAGNRAIQIVALSLGLIVCAIVGLGAYSLTIREDPSVTLSALPHESTSGVLVRARASATSLRSDDNLLLQVVGIDTVATVADDVQDNLCTVVLQEVDRDNQQALRDGVRLLHWVETGANAEGKTTASVDLVVEEGSNEAFCVYAALSSAAFSGVRWAWAYALSP